MKNDVHITITLSHIDVHFYPSKIFMPAGRMGRISRLFHAALCEAKQRIASRNSARQRWLYRPSAPCGTAFRYRSAQPRLAPTARLVDNRLMRVSDHFATLSGRSFLIAALLLGAAVATPALAPGPSGRATTRRQAQGGRDAQQDGDAGVGTGDHRQSARPRQR
jgi:hypothetical protein